jgi:hypothetical protein
VLTLSLNNGIFVAFVAFCKKLFTHQANKGNKESPKTFMKRDTLPDCIRYKGRTYRRSDTKDRITYPRKKLLAVLRTLNEFVVSLDRIGSASYDMAKVDNNAALADFIERHKIFRKMAQARAIYLNLFPPSLVLMEWRIWSVSCRPFDTANR